MSESFDQSHVTGTVQPHKFGPIVTIGDRQWQLIYSIDRNEDRWEPLEPGEYELLNAGEEAEYQKWKQHHQRYIIEINTQAFEREMQLQGRLSTAAGF